MGWAWDATENSRLPPLRGRTACRRVALSEGRGCGLSGIAGNVGDLVRPNMRAARSLPLIGVASERHEACQVLWSEVHPQGYPKGIRAKVLKILVEIPIAR